MMDKVDFETLVANTKAARPMWFQLDRDDPASLREIEAVEHEIGAELSAGHRDFLRTHGAGLFAFAKVLGVRPGTEWYILDHRYYAAHPVTP